MYLSKYLKFYPYPLAPELNLLFSTKRASMALVAADDCIKMQNGHIPEEYIETLTELGMLVPDLEEEKREVRNLLNEVNRLDSSMDAAIIVGLACNFSCVYCYEGSMKKGQSMDQETINRLVSFLKERYVSRNKNKLRLDFYGGEPLLYTDTIINITAPLKEFVEGLGGDFQYSLVTNGSLLTREMIAKLLPTGLFGAKVTVDGPPEEHNRLRPFTNGQPSFDSILTNIRNCNGLIKIGFGGNYTRDNYKRIEELLDGIKQYNITPETVDTVQFTPVMQTGDKFSNPEFTGGCASFDEPWVSAASIEVRRQVLERGFKTPRMTPSPCMVDLEDAFVVNHDGRLYKCVAMIGHPEYSCGDVRNGMQDYSRIYHLDHWRQNSKCPDCEYLPLCFGGCRYMKFQQAGSMEDVECLRNYYDRVIKDTVLQDALFQPEGSDTEDRPD